MKVLFFKTPSEFRKWLEDHHQQEIELWIGFHKRSTGKPSITWPESVDEALCFGWIDGVRKSIDESSYKIRFTPRRSRSIWSAVNMKRAQELIETKRMHSSGLTAFQSRDEKRSAIYSYERRQTKLDPSFEKMFRSNKKAWGFFQSQAPWYQQACTSWVMSGKKEETRIKRLETLIQDSFQERRIKPLTRPDKNKSRLTKRAD
jgi:uncharacterized protein YdeI (YjbR/CyaY-like superfamily)